MNPEAIPVTQSHILVLCILTIIGGFALGSFAMWYCAVYLRRTKPGAKPKTYIKVHHFTLEQTLTLAGLWDEMDSGKRLAKVKFWQTLRTMVPEEDNHESMEIENVNHSRWNVKITKEGEEPKPKNPPAPVLPESLIAPKPEEPKP